MAGRDRGDGRDERGLIWFIWLVSFSQIDQINKRDQPVLALHAARSVAARLYIMVVVTGVAFLLQGCMMGPDYKRPETPQADSWRVSPATSESMANLPWWELLKDETLQQLI